MKIKILYPFLLLLTIGITHSYAQSVLIDTTTYYSIVDKTIQEKVQQFGAGNVLVVLDIDNTILTGDTDLGSDIWYQWQTDKLDIKPRPDQKLAKDCLFNEAINLLYELGTMSLTDSLLPGFISKWQKSGVTVFALTSRSPQCRAATERELLRFDIDLSLTSLRTADGREVLFDQVSDSNLSYQDGIFMTRGAHKGDMLADILNRSGRSFRTIIVADDTKKNIDNIKDRSSTYGADDIVLFYYTRIITERLKHNNNMILTPEQALQMDKDWDLLISTLITVFPERMERSECVNWVRTGKPSGQSTDTLTFYSNVFNVERSVYVTIPEFYKYQSDLVKLPVIYILDGQHEWFVNPLLSTINYLQYTHEIPQAIVVIIPLIDRNTECSINNMQGETSPLHKFITQELDEKIKPYHPNGFKLLIGHSFSASFALYSYLRSPDYYSAVISNTPLDKFEELVWELESNKLIDRNNISIATGGIAMNKDFYHRRTYDDLKAKYPSFFKSITIFEADNSAHNAVPIVAAPFLLTKIFEEFSGRYSIIAEVDHEYRLVENPGSIDGELSRINEASTLGNYFYNPEIPDLNGMASRYVSSGFNEYGIAVYELGIKYFPDYYEFHLALYELYLPTDIAKSKFHLYKAVELLETIDINLIGRRELINEINNEKIKNGW